MGIFSDTGEEKLGAEVWVHERSTPASGLGLDLLGTVYSSFRALYKGAVLLASLMKFLSHICNSSPSSHLTHERKKLRLWGVVISSHNICNRIRMRNELPAHIFATDDNSSLVRMKENHRAHKDIMQIILCFLFFLLGMPYHPIPWTKLSHKWKHQFAGK